MIFSTLTVISLIGCGSPGGTGQSESTGASNTGTTSTTSGLITNGDFENGVSSWGGNAANVENIENNNVNSSNNELAANPWDVNLQQVVTLLLAKTTK